MARHDRPARNPRILKCISLALLGALAWASPAGAQDTIVPGDSSHFDFVGPVELIEQTWSDSAYLVFDDGRIWVNADCVNDVKAANIVVHELGWDAIDEIVTAPGTRTCDTALAILETSHVDRGDSSRILITADKIELGSDGWVLLNDDSVQWLSPECRATLTPRFLPIDVVSFETVQAHPVASEPVECADLYGPPTTECPAGSNAESSSRCTADGFAAEYIVADHGGSVALGEHVLWIPAGALSRDCYASITLIGGTSVADYEIHCPWQGSVEITMPAVTVAGEPPVFEHFKDGAVVEEEVTLRTDTTITASVTSLSWFRPSWLGDENVERLTRYGEEGALCAANVSRAMHPWERLFAPQLPAQVCLEVFIIGRSINTWVAPIIDAQDEGRFQSGDVGPSDAIRHCFWSAWASSAVGPRLGLSAVNAHEASSWTEADTAMDFNNNRVGASLAHLSHQDQLDTCARLTQRGTGNRIRMIAHGQVLTPDQFWQVMDDRAAAEAAIAALREQERAAAIAAEHQRAVAEAHTAAQITRDLQTQAARQVATSLHLYNGVSAANVRAKPTTASAVVDVIYGSSVVHVVCYVWGQDVHASQAGSNPYWYRLDTGSFISDSVLETNGIPQSGVPAC